MNNIISKGPNDYYFEYLLIAALSLITFRKIKKLEEKRREIKRTMRELKKYQHKI
ncbi:hypothetical protein [Bacillus taeanensis]|uniref:hypothetical protein n=1 Tax=Bacillus taeanensis TaxID=273032 RepID=UPI0015F01D39|nr:hypothetical protein [Bacillus taeanensis]